MEIIEKRTFELKDDEINCLANIINRNLYNSACKNPEAVFFSYPDAYNLIVLDGKDYVGIFQMRELRKSESFYFMSAAVNPEYRGASLYNTAVKRRLDIVKELDRGHVGTASMNPLVIGNLIRGHDFHLPNTEDTDIFGLLQKAKEILFEAEGSHYDVRDNFVIPGANFIGKYPICKGYEPFDDPEIEEFMRENMDREAGDRLFLIKRMI